jgi:elongation factor 2
VLTLNKIDRCFLDLNMDGNVAYLMFREVIESTNKMISRAACEDPLFGDVQVYPENGTVAFSAGLHGWAFTLRYFAKVWAAKMDMNEKTLMERLWGENFFDPKTEEWTNKPTGSATCQRGFVLFVYKPIQEMIKACMLGHKDRLWGMLAKMNCELKADEKELVGEALMKRTMQVWLPLASALLEMMIFHLPSLATAQKYRVQNLYQGPSDDQYARTIRNCDPNGPLMLYVARVISNKGRSLALGRVFSGKISNGRYV